MIKLRTKPFDLPLKHVFTIARGSTSVQPTLIVEAESGGKHGYGEATTNDYYGATLENMAAAIERITPIVEAAAPDRLEEVLAAAARELGLGPETTAAAADSHARPEAFALCAVDLALHDLWGKTRGAPLAELWGLEPGAGPASNLTIGIDTIPKMVDKLLEEPGWPVYKIKLGTPDDVAIVRELRKHTDATLRVDANCGWTATKTIELSGELKQLGVEFIEQPLPANDRDGMRDVFERSALPVIADESCVDEVDVARCEGRFHGINIKLVKCGGLASARRMIADARRRGMQVMVGCMTESTVGVSAIAQLLPLLDHVDMDGAALLAEDIATGARLERGHCHLPAGAGSGVALIGGPLGAG